VSKQEKNNTTNVVIVMLRLTPQSLIFSLANGSYIIHIVVKANNQ